MEVNGVVEAEKGKRIEKVENWRPAMTTWQGGEESPRGQRGER